MIPLKFNLIIYVLNLNFNVMYAAIQQQSYKKIKNCSMPNHIQASEVVIEEIQTASLTKCSAICSESLQCGAVMFDRPSRKCHLIDKDYQVCDENIGVYEVVKSDFCYNGGVLLNDAQCLCDEAFGGRFCKADAHRLNDCTEEVCQNGGSCIDLFYDLRCECVSPFYGRHCETTLDNIALDQPVMVSSTDYDGLSSYAVDGNTLSNLFLDGCTHTAGAGSTDPWLTVDFDERRFVVGVDIVNRGDCCGERLRDFVTYVSTDDANPMLSTDREICFAYEGAVAQGATVQLTCMVELNGRYFSIVIPGPNKILSVCEVTVFGY